MAGPEITVIIPTRERCDVLAACLRTVTAQSYGNLSIVVSDNASTDATAAVVAAAADQRIRYVNPGTRVSMSHNWEFALGFVAGGWVTFIGDDDGLIPNAIANAARLIETSGVKAIRSRSCTYNWPDNRWAAHGHLIAPTGSAVRMRDSKRWLEHVLSGKATYRNLPLIYNGGFVRMDVLDAIKARTGRYFSSSIPDVYSAVAIASVVDRYAYTQQPFAISGISRHSTGTSLFSTKSSGDPIPQKTFSGEGNLPIHPAFPPIDNGYPASLHALTYESYLQSSKLRPAEPPRHAEQLPIILASAGQHAAAMEAWGHRFAALHGLDFDWALQASRRCRPGIRANLFMTKLMDAFHSRSAGSANVPLFDVEAASSATALLRNPPGPFSTLRREFARVRSERER